ncbi:MAG: LysM domain-containing protein, partial [Comamonas sp.]
MLSRSPSLLPTSLLIALGALLPGAVQAASADQLPDIRHEVQTGDTLEAVAKRYLKDPQQWR